MFTKNPQPPKLAIVTPAADTTLVRARDAIDDVRAVILVACAAIRDVGGGTECNSVAVSYTAAPISP